VREIAQRRTSPRRSSGDMSAAKVRRNRRRSRLKKHRSKGPRSYNGFLFISAVRFVSIPTSYNDVDSYLIIFTFWSVLLKNEQTSIPVI
jgi:hypothetical protein